MLGKFVTVTQLWATPEADTVAFGKSVSATQATPKADTELPATSGYARTRVVGNRVTPKADTGRQLRNRAMPKAGTGRQLRYRAAPKADTGR